MDRIARVFKEKKKVFIGRIIGGDPTLNHTEEIIYAMERGGADLIEIGIPYSDPLADGPVIQRAAGRAMNNGFSIEGLFESVENIRKNTEIPLMLQAYYNTIYAFGTEKFAKRCRESGVDALIVPDLPLEEEDEFPQEIIHLIPLVAFNSQERVEKIVEGKRGFVYCISSFGSARDRSDVSDKTRELVELVKSHTDLPVAVGFGISNRERVEEVQSYADATIVENTIVRVVEESNGNVDKVEKYISGLTGRNSSLNR